MERYRSGRQYSLDGCSVTRERIVGDLRPILERFGFDTRETPFLQRKLASDPLAAETGPPRPRGR